MVNKWEHLEHPGMRACARGDGECVSETGQRV